MSDKPSTWVLTNAVPTINEKASALTDTALTVTSDSIVKNGKPTDGKVIHLTVAHVSHPSFRQSVKADGTMTISRIEGKRGRGSRKATPAPVLNDFLAKFRAK